ncbi:hypothetical protein [Treponema sp.]|uniref:hypothetical protein n=1 Tax=Treponema sp. TaxID=166 RepID=UPI00388F6005
MLLSVLSCSSSKPVVIWTDRPEIVSYIEFFNVAQNKSKAVVVYKEKLAASLPPVKDEQNPDIVIGSFLRNSRSKKNFASLDRVFNRRGINPDTIYGPLLEYGKISGRQYLIPVSFNIPTMIFSGKNEKLIGEKVFIDCDEIRDSGAVFNQKSSEDVYVKMGYAPSWDSDFAYEVAKMTGAGFTDKGNVFQWNKELLSQSIEYLKNWSLDKNTDTESEQEFSFKYLYAPKHKLVASERCLFAYTSSNDIFGISSEQLESIDFKWLSKNGKIFVKDEITMLGLYKKSKNTEKAYQFIQWFFLESTQKNLIDRAMQMKLGTQTFGICNGFSSVKTVNERVFPAYYKTLLGKMPAADILTAPLPLPSRWESLKERVIVPYITESISTEQPAIIKSIDERLILWRNQFN